MVTKALNIAPVWSRITDLTIERGEGVYVYTTAGETYLDFSSGIGVTNTGHCHPRVVAAIQSQAERLIHGQVNCYYHEALFRATDALNSVTPSHIDSFFFSNSGAEAVEGAVKLARHATKRPNVIVFQGGFHGRTAQTMAMTTAKIVYRYNYQPLPAGVFVAPFPAAYRYHMSESAASDWAIAELELLLKSQSAPEETAAIVIEPVLGEGGYIPAPKPFLKELRSICDEHGILLVMDEVQSGFGRTGKFFAHEHAGIKADVIVMAKGLGSGFPVSCVASGKALMDDWHVGTHGGTYGGNPMGCAAVEATISVIQDEGLLDNALARGRQLQQGLKALQQRFPVIGDVRGLGLMIGCEFTDPDSGMPNAALQQRVMAQALNPGKLILLGCGVDANAIRWIPPLVVTQDQMSQAIDIFEDALAQVA